MSDEAKNKAAADRMMAARIAETMLNHPYLARMYESVTFIESDDCPSPMAVDEYWRVYYNPTLLMKYPEDTLPTMLYHEIMHPMRRHMKRAKDMEHIPHHLLGAAANYEINDDIVEEEEEKNLARNGKPRVKYADDIQLAKEVGLPNGKTYEEYAHILYEMFPQIPPPPGGGGDNNEGEGDGDNESNGPGNGNGEGSGASGKHRPWELDAPSKDNDLPGISKSRQELIVRDVAQKILEEADKSRGSVPAHLQIAAKEVIDPHVPWERILGPMIRHSMNMAPGMDEDTYSKSHRRQDWESDWIKPGSHKPVPNIAVVADTSGSMLSGDELACVLGTIDSLISSMGSDVTVIPCDAEVAKNTVQKIWTITKIKLFGGGGTDMGAGIAAACDLKPQPGVIVVATDGLTPWPKDRPKVPVIICQIGDPHGYKPPTWAKVIEIDPAKLKCNITKR